MSAERVREFYRKQGEKREQERIIALLEAEILTLCIMGKFEKTNELKTVIKIIKGENK